MHQFELDHTTKIKVRKAGESDLPMVKQIAKENWEITFDYRKELKDTDSVLIVSESGQGCMAVTTGYALMKISQWNRTGNPMELAVKSEWKRNGIGKALVERLIEECYTRNLRTLVIETQPRNTDSNEFYQALGFRICGYNDRYYTSKPEGPGDIALFYSLDIS